MASDKEKGQALSDAAFEGNVDKLTALLASGFHIDLRDKDGFTALHRSCVTGNLALIQFLLSKNASVNVEDTYGDSPMHYACFCGHAAVVTALLAAGGDPNKRSKDGKTPLRSAQDEGHALIVTLLVQHNAARGVIAAPFEKAVALPPPPAFLLPGGQTGASGSPTSSGAPPSALPAKSSATTAGKVAGLDFSTGVIIEGELGKKRKNRMLKWRRKYFVFSRTYGALFFWTGTRDRVDGVIKKVRFETLLSVVHHPDKKGGKRFDLRVVTGRMMRLLAANVQEAKKWVTTLHAVVGRSMAAIRIQSAWRRFRAQRQKRKLLAERSAAVVHLASVAGGGSAMGSLGQIMQSGKKLKPSSVSSPLAGAAVRSPGNLVVHGAIKSTASGAEAVMLSRDGILIEGELKKKNSSGLSSLLSAYRTRYFVLHQHDAALYYFETKAQRQAGMRPRAVPVLSFYSVRHIADRKGTFVRAFELRVVSGRSFIFEARSVPEAEKWVTFLQAVLPRKHVAAIKIQKNYRRFMAKLRVKKLKAEKAARPPAAVAAATGAVPEDAGKWVKYAHATTGRDYWHNTKTSETSWTDPDVARIGDWVPTKDPGTGRTYYFNAVTKVTSWDVPSAVAASAVPSSVATSVVAEVTPQAAVPAPSAVLPPPPLPAPSASTAAAVSGAKPSRWIKKSDPASSREFYANVDTSETSWVLPPGLADGSARIMGEWFSKIPVGPGGRKFYVHVESNRTQWDRPDGYSSDDTSAPAAVVVPPAAASVAKPPSNDWSEITDEAGGPSYFYNNVTKESVWEQPAAMGPASRPPPPPPPVAATATSRPSLRKQNSASAITPVSGSAAARVSLKGGVKNVSMSNVGSSAETPKRVSMGTVGGSGGLRRSISTRIVGVGAGAADSSGGAGVKGAAGVDVDGWRQSVDIKTNRTYFYNVFSGESAWERPGSGKASELATPVDADEVLTFSSWVNQCLADDAALAAAGTLPLDLSADVAPIFSAMRSGVLACKLVNAVAKDAVDMRAVDIDAADDSEAAADNCRLALAAAQSVGCLVTKDLTPAALVAGETQPVLDFLWQLCKLQLFAPVSVRNRDISGLVLLAGEDESLEELLRIPPEALLLRWFNFQVTHVREGSVGGAPIKEFGPTIASGLSLCALVRSVFRSAVESGVPETDALAASVGPDAAIEAALSAAFGLGVPAWFSVNGIVKGNLRLQLALFACIFKFSPNMPESLPTASVVTGAASSAAAAARMRSGTGSSEIIVPPRGISHAHALQLRTALHTRLANEDKDGDKQNLSREARTVAQWVNALDIEGVALHGLALGQELRDGVGLLKVLDVVEPGLVKWSKVNGRPTNRYKMVENCNYAVTLGRAMDFHLVNMAGLDLVDGNTKLLLGYMWQLMRHHTLKQLSALAFDGFAADEGEVLLWANRQVAAAVVATGQPAEAAVKVSSFADPELCTGIYLLYLLAAARPGCVNWDVVTDGDGREQQEANAKYVISTARKLDAVVLCSWEDIADIKPRAVLLLVAALMVADSERCKAAALSDGLAGVVEDDAGEEDESDNDIDDS